MLLFYESMEGGKEKGRYNEKSQGTTEGKYKYNGTTKKVKVQRKIFNGATKIFWHSHSIFLQVQQKIFHPYIPELHHSYL